MAVCQIWKVNNLKRVINYTTNAKKTSKDEAGYKEVHNVKDYNDLDFDTEEQCFVSGINCSPKTAYDEMMITKSQFNKKDGIQGFHAFQSFKEGEVTPEIAHEIGVKLANEMWGDRFEVVVSTHLNTDHIHNHFVINSVSYRDGKKYYDNRINYANMRKISDSLCEEYGLSVIKERPTRRHIDYSNYFLSGMKKINYYTIAKADLDRAINEAYNYEDFEKLMKAMDYTLTYRAGKLSIRKKGYKRNIRVERFFGDDYSYDNLKEKIKNTYSPKEPFIEVYARGNNKVHSKDYKNHKGIVRLFLYYCYLLGVFPSKERRKRLTPEMRLEVYKMEKLSEETRLLVRENIETDEHFFSFKEKINNEYENYKKKKSSLWYEHKKAKKSEDKMKVFDEIKDIDEVMKKLKKEVDLCEDIELRKDVIKENIRKQEERGDINNEFIK